MLLKMYLLQELMLAYRTGCDDTIQAFTKSLEEAAKAMGDNDPKLPGLMFAITCAQAATEITKGMKENGLQA